MRGGRTSDRGIRTGKKKFTEEKRGERASWPNIKPTVR